MLLIISRFSFKKLLFHQNWIDDSKARKLPAHSLKTLLLPKINLNEKQKLVQNAAMPFRNRKLV